MSLIGHNPLTQLPAVAIPGVLELENLPTETRYDLRLRASSLPAIASLLGFSLPEKMGDVLRVGQVKAICVGPDEWMLSTSIEDGDELRHRLFAGTETIVMSVVEVSDRTCSLRVHGPKAAYAIKAACPHDVVRMPIGTATRTLFDQADVLIEKEGEDVFRLEMLRSWSVHVSSLMAIVSREVATGI